MNLHLIEVYLIYKVSDATTRAGSLFLFCLDEKIKRLHLQMSLFSSTIYIKLKLFAIGVATQIGIILILMELIRKFKAYIHH